MKKKVATSKKKNKPKAAMCNKDNISPVKTRNQRKSAKSQLGESISRKQLHSTVLDELVETGLCEKRAPKFPQVVDKRKGKKLTA